MRADVVVNRFEGRLCVGSNQTWFEMTCPYGVSACAVWLEEFTLGKAGISGRSYHKHEWREEGA